MIKKICLAASLSLIACGSNGGGGSECGPVFQQVDGSEVHFNPVTLENVTPEELPSVEERLQRDGGYVVKETPNLNGTTTVVGCSIVGDTVTDDDNTQIDNSSHDQVPQ